MCNCGPWGLPRYHFLSPGSSGAPPLCEAVSWFNARLFYSWLHFTWVFRERPTKLYKLLTVQKCLFLLLSGMPLFPFSAWTYTIDWASMNRDWKLLMGGSDISVEIHCWLCGSVITPKRLVFKICRMFPYFSLDKLDSPGLLYRSSTFETIFPILAHRIT